MVGDARKFVRYPGLTAVRPVARRLLLGICFNFVFGSLCAGPARSADTRSAPAGSSGPGAQIAIADFDGDRYPDLASVQAGSSDGSRTSYWIRLRLTTAGHQSIQVIGPIGGLEIAARDVNGDHAIDLVLTAAWLRQPVAILLNDGHGNFSRAEPSDFTGAFEHTSATWGAPAFPISLAAVNPSQWRTDISAPARGLLRPRQQRRVAPPADSGVLPGSFLISRHGRAPPSGVSDL